MIKSPITGKEYSPENNHVAYLSNMKQAFLYLKNGAVDDLVDILFTDTRNDCLVFVFRKSDCVKKLYEMWNQHAL